NIKKDKKIQLLETLLESDNPLTIQQAQESYRKTIAQIDDDLAFLETANKGSEFMQESDKQRVREIAQYQWLDEGDNLQPLLTENEIYNLCIDRGTLTAEERTVINNHIVMTQKMLKALPLPDNLKNVAEIAGNHHERMDGKGYPNGLTGGEMSLQARMMCIADIFEALTAADRPYKKAMPLSVALDILEKMKDDQHIDPDLFEVFMQQKVYLSYARDFLKEEQIDVNTEDTALELIKKATGQN
ncbi:MAG: HD domain-containing phosphohydrolase, partial [Gammaproteobacteria bacterium]|nr:HD domain-containing phosphohydrolase [Gammaproteobacteria bacterium]